jgi:transposase
MTDNHSELRVIRQNRDGRRRYDETAKRALVEAALRPGTSVARLALEHGINANLLRKWMTKYLMQRENTAPALPRSDSAGSGSPATIEMDTPVELEVPRAQIQNPSAERAQSAFVPVVAAAPTPASVPCVPRAPASFMTVALHVRLTNGVEFDLGEANVEELTAIVQMLGRLPCSGSTKD